ncbi:hypothetical protein F4779DRAFT_74595 [Xylariaceae sp. FL0662B]|nr:hypothetical protein F4779DRAFT_74595 [Xylariaceae sp. FL0662B]
MAQAFVLLPLLPRCLLSGRCTITAIIIINSLFTYYTTTSMHCPFRSLSSSSFYNIRVLHPVTTDCTRDTSEASYPSSHSLVPDSYRSEVCLARGDAYTYYNSLRHL